MEILQFFIKIGITSHQWVLIKEFIWLIIINNEKNSLTFLSFTWLFLPIFKFRDQQWPRKMQKKTVLFFKFYCAIKDFIYILYIDNINLSIILIQYF